MRGVRKSVTMSAPAVRIRMIAGGYQLALRTFSSEIGRGAVPKIKVVERHNHCLLIVNLGARTTSTIEESAVNTQL